MPRRVNPVGPRRLDERAYEQALRQIILAPLMRSLRRGLSEAAAAGQAFDALRGVVGDHDRMERLVAREVAAHAARLDGYHRRRLIQTFRAALGVDIRPVLSDTAIQPLMDAWRRENVRLIRTVPQRMQDGLYRRMTQTFASQPFDQKSLSRIVATEGRVSGYNLRRITRDQTSKAIGQLTQARHRQIGIEEYTWRTAQDERVRDTHSALDGTLQRWDTPPGVGHPGQDIQCRCVAIPYIPEAGIGRRPAAQAPQTEPTTMPQSPQRAGFSTASTQPFVGDARLMQAHMSDPLYVARESSPGLRSYTADGFRSLNSKMRTGQRLTGRDLQMSNDLLAAMRDQPRARIVFRGVPGWADKELPTFRPGQVYTLKSPQSASTNLGQTADWGHKGHVFEIHADAGVRAVVTNATETEIIFRWNQSFEVLGVYNDVDVTLANGDRLIARKYVVGRLRRGVPTVIHGVLDASRA